METWESEYLTFGCSRSAVGTYSWAADGRTESERARAVAVRQLDATREARWNAEVRGNDRFTDSGSLGCVWPPGHTT